MLPEINITKQEAFDRMYNHLIEQGERSIDSYGAFCRYRGEGGLKCAVGALIPDELYNPIIEGCPVRLLCSDGIFDKSMSELLESCQRVHDRHLEGVTDSEEWRTTTTARFKEIAECHGLEMP